MKPTYRYRATLVRVVDGDTVDFLVDMGFRMSSVQRFRLYGIDTPERGQKGWADSTEFFKTLLADGNVIIETQKDPDNFGRWLCVIWRDGFNINQKMIDDGYAVEYKK